MDLMNKKYKDREGNKYVVRFIKESRKLEIFKLQTKSEIVKTVIPVKPKVEETDLAPVETPKTIPEIISKSRFDELDFIPKIEKTSTLAKIKAIFTLGKIKAVEEEISLDDFDLNIDDSKSEVKIIQNDNEFKLPTNIADEKFFLSNILKSLSKNKDRITATIVNLKNSRIFELTGDPSENKNILSNISRDFDSDIFRPLENYSNKLKEILTYPKSINHYSMNYTRTQKDLLASLASNETRFEYVLRWELQVNLGVFSNKFSRMTNELLDLLNTKTEMEIKKLNSIQEQQFRDGKIAIVICLDDLTYLRRIIDLWNQSVK